MSIIELATEQKRKTVHPRLSVGCVEEVGVDEAITNGR